MLLRREFLLASALAFATRANADNDPWTALRAGNAMVMMRHALAPGTGDPAGFQVDDCSTQRNLSEEGRAQARAVGDLFRSNGITDARVYSSQWCRCLDTASLLGVGQVQQQPLLNSFFAKREDASPQTEALRTWLTGLPQGKPIVLVSHQVNITGLTGVVPASGELVFLSTDPATPLAVLGRVATR